MIFKGIFLGLPSLIVKAAVGIKALVVAMGSATLATRILVGATGVGLLLVAAGLVYQYWDKIWPAVTNTFKAFANAIKGYASGVGNILLGLVTFDMKKIKQGMNELGEQLKKDIGKVIEKVKGEVKDKGSVGDIAITGNVKGAVDTPVEQDTGQTDKIEKMKEEMTNEWEEKKLMQDIQREEEMLRDEEFFNMQNLAKEELDMEKYGAELERLQKFYNSEDAVNKQNAIKRMKQIVKQAKMELQLKRKIADQTVSLTRDTLGLIAHFTGENNSAIFYAGQALAAGQIVMDSMRGVAALAPFYANPATAGYAAAMNSLIYAKMGVGLATVAAQTFVPKKAQRGAFVDLSLIHI